MPDRPRFNAQQHAQRPMSAPHFTPVVI
jgi:hypothetical protein